MSLGKMAIVCAGFVVLATSLFAQEKSEMEKRWSAQAMDRTRAFELNDKKFKDSSFKTKSFATSTSGLQKSFQTKTFESTTFKSKDSAMAKQTFKTDKASQQDMQFQTQGAASVNDKKFQSKEYADQQKQLQGSDQKVTSPTFKPEAKTPGYWEAFRGKLKKDLTMDEIRELLNKPPQ